MKTFYKAFLLTVFLAISGYSQTVSPTPIPPIISFSENEAKKEPTLELSKPVFESMDSGRHIIVSARASKLQEFAPLGFQIEVYIREKTWDKKINSDENQSVFFFIDGQSFPASKQLFDKTVIYNGLTTDPAIYTRTFVLDLSSETLDSLIATRSISIVWEEGNIEIPSTGLEIFSDFALKVKQKKTQ